MSGNTTAIERLLEVSNKLWDAMYESGEVPTYAERAHYYLALKDAMDENANLRELVRMMWKSYCWANSGYETYLTDEQDVKVRNFVRKLGIEVPS